MLAVIGRMDTRQRILTAQLWHGTDWRPLIDELAGLGTDIDRLRGMVAATWRELIAEARGELLQPADQDQQRSKPAVFL